MNTDSPEDFSIVPEGHSSRGRLERVLRRGEFAVTAELNPPDSADPNEVYERGGVFDGWVDGNKGDAQSAGEGSGVKAPKACANKQVWLPLTDRSDHTVEHPVERLAVVVIAARHIAK